MPAIPLLFGALERSYRSQRKATHEFKNQLQAVHELLSLGEVQDALNYVEQLQGKQTTRILAVNSGHPIIDAVLNAKHQAAQESNIEMQVQLNNLSSVSIETDALVVILSNLLDNAIEACQRIEGDRRIRCKLEVGTDFFLSISNTSLPVTIKDDRIVSTKPNKAEHGYGLPNVLRILDSLNGEYSIVYRDGWFIFSAEIPDAAK